MISIFDIEQATWAPGVHVDGSDKSGRWFANYERCIEHPRLQRYTKNWRRPHTQPVTLWVVDGAHEAPSAEAALRYLNDTPMPDVTALEGALLKLLEDDWREETGKLPPAAEALINKGLIEVRHVDGNRSEFRRTDLGRALLAQPAS